MEEWWRIYFIKFQKVSSINRGPPFDLAGRESVIQLKGLSVFLEVLSSVHKRFNMLMDAMLSPRPVNSYVIYIHLTSSTSVSSEKKLHFIGISLFILIFSVFLLIAMEKKKDIRAMMEHHSITKI